MTGVVNNRIPNNPTVIDYSIGFEKAVYNLSPPFDEDLSSVYIAFVTSGGSIDGELQTPFVKSNGPYIVNNLVSGTQYSARISSVDEFLESDISLLRNLAQNPNEEVLNLYEKQETALLAPSVVSSSNILDETDPLYVTNVEVEFTGDIGDGLVLEYNIGSGWEVAEYFFIVGNIYKAIVPVGTNVDLKFYGTKVHVDGTVEKSTERTFSLNITEAGYTWKESISDALSNLDDNFDDLNNDIKNLEAGDWVSSIDSVVEDISQDIQEVFDRRENIDTEEKKRIQEFDQLKVEIDGETQAINTRIDEVEVDVNGNASAISGLQLSVSDLDTDLTSTINRVDAVEIDANNNASAISVLEGQVNNPSTNTSALYQSVLAAQSTADGNTTSISTLELDVSNLETGLSSTIDRVDAVEIDANNNASAISGVQGQIDNPESNTSALYQFVQQAQATADGNTSSIASLSTRVSDNEDFASAQLQLNSQYDASIDALTARAALVTDVNNRITGVIIEDDGVNRTIEFQSDSVKFIDGSGNTRIYFDPVNDRYVFDGEIIAQSGTFNGELIAATGTFAGSLSAATGTFSGSLSAASGTFTGQISGGSANYGSGNLIIDTNGFITQDGGYYRTADQFSGDSRVLIDGRAAGTADYRIWVGTGNATDTNALFYIKPNGEGFIAGEFFQGQLLRERFASSNTNTATATGHVSNGNDVKLTIEISSSYTFTTTTNPEETPITPLSYTVSRSPGSTLDSGSFQPYRNVFYESETGEYTVSEVLYTTITIVDTGTTAGSSYDYTIDFTQLFGNVNQSCSISTYENLIG